MSFTVTTVLYRGINRLYFPCRFPFYVTLPKTRLFRRKPGPESEAGVFKFPTATRGVTEKTPDNHHYFRAVLPG
jgi:hypothetical protein